MSLPKRDGVHDRYYLIHKPDTSPEVLVEADLCIQDVLNGTARENHSAYPTVVRNHNGTPFLPDQLLERYLAGLLLKKFPCEDAVSVLRRWMSFGNLPLPAVFSCFTRSGRSWETKPRICSVVRDSKLCPYIVQQTAT